MDNELKQALDFARDGKWDDAHEIVQQRSDAGACWIHAYLHRVEGDSGNARYWYHRAGKPFPNYGLEDELKELTGEFST